MHADTAACLLAGALAAIALPCAAQSVADLDRIQSETILYRAEAARAEALAKARGGTAETADVLPVVRGVFGTGSSLFATFLYPNGASVDAPVNARIPGGFVVAKVSPTAVELVRGGTRFSLGFSDQRPMPVTPVAPSTSDQGPGAVDPYAR